MLLHGTNLNSSVRILNKEFSAGEYNGVSMTTSAAVAVRYSLENIETSKKDDSFLFLSEILEFDSLVEVAGKDQIINRKITKIMRQHQFKKRVRTLNCERVLEEDGHSLRNEDFECRSEFQRRGKLLRQR